MPTLRPATTADTEKITTIWYEGWRDGHLGHVPDELTTVRTPSSFRARTVRRLADTVVAVVDGTVAGFVMVAGDEVEQVYVAAGSRGSGVAALLLDAAEALVAAGGHPRAWLAVVAGNTRARRFYQRRGWTDDGPFTYEAATADGTVGVPAHRYVKPLGGV
jgi:GNAT superfamily N-acetyltransferase